MLRSRHNFRRSKPMNAMSEINVTSLLDLCFCLLIIFMIATPLMDVSGATQSIPLNLPVESAKQQLKKSDDKAQEISVDLVGRYYWGDKSVDLAELDKLVQNLARQNPDTVISVRGDAEVPFQKVINVLDILMKYDMTQMSIATRSGK